MVDREKVIKGLECCINGCDDECPYWTSPSGNVSICMSEMKKDALALLKAQNDQIIMLERGLMELKAQTPRVMTLDEVKMLDSDYYYLESMRSPGKELREIVGAYGLTCVTWPSITWARQTLGDSGYGKTWRCWTSRPTDEQREAVKWE